MNRGIGVVSEIQQVLPEWGAIVAGLLTQLGDIWFLLLVLGVLYWQCPDEQSDIAVVGGIFLAGIGIYRGLKELFELPRPEQPLLEAELVPWLFRPLYEATATAAGYGFPSGHATGSTIVYLGLAGVLTVGTRSWRFGVAAALVTTVSLTRLVLGVHYLVDVVVGVLLGATLVIGWPNVAGRLPGDTVTGTFCLALLSAAFYLVTSGAEVEAIALFVGTLGALGGWQLIAPERRADPA